MKIQDLYRESKEKPLDADSARRLLSALNAYIWTFEGRPIGLSRDIGVVI